MEFTMEQKKAISIIKNYLNVVDNTTWTNEYIMGNYDFVVDQIIENSNKLKIKVPGISSMSESNQSMSFQNGVEAWTITSDVASMLPKPFVKMFY